VIYSAENGVEYSGNKCWCCARLKQELKSAIIELESATETIRKLREVFFHDAIEVTTIILFNNC
jgi:hypothetical protein